MTAEEFLNKKGVTDGDMILSSTFPDVVETMIEFTKYHVEQALRAASEKAELKYYPYNSCFECGREDASVNEDSILNAYSLSNIK